MRSDLWFGNPLVAGSNPADAAVLVGYVIGGRRDGASDRARIASHGPAVAGLILMLLVGLDRVGGRGRAVLEQLVAYRIRAMGAVADRMSNEDRAALVQGALAFTCAKHRMSDQSREQRSQSRQSGGSRCPETDRLATRRRRNLLCLVNYSATATAEAEGQRDSSI